jgi:DNA-binding NarL/FixJ family response regulator
MGSAILIEKHQLDRRAMSRVMEDDCDLHVIAEADSVSEALLMSRNYCPEWLFVTADDDPMGTLDMLMRIHCNFENTRIVIFATDKFEPYVQRALKIGVSACVNKGSSAAELQRAVNRVQQGKRFMSDEYARYVIGNDEQQAKRGFLNRLTNRELQIMLLFVENLKVDQIAARLCLSPKTVSTYRYRIFDKLGVRGDVALMHMAYDHGLLNTNNKYLHNAA